MKQREYKVYTDRGRVYGVEKDKDQEWLEEVLDDIGFSGWEFVCIHPKRNISYSSVRLNQTILQKIKRTKINPSFP